MAHSHEFAFRSVVLKTPQGYLSKSGFTQDVTSQEVLVIRAGLLGGLWASKQSRLEMFKEYFNISTPIDENDCEFFTYHPSDETRTKLYKWY